MMAHDDGTSKSSSWPVDGDTPRRVFQRVGTLDGLSVASRGYQSRDRDGSRWKVRRSREDTRRRQGGVVVMQREAT